MDILSDVDEIKVCVAYKDDKDSEVNHFPSSLSYLAKCKPVYKTFSGWYSSDIDISKGVIPDKMKIFLVKIDKAIEERIINDIEAKISSRINDELIYTPLIPMIIFLLIYLKYKRFYQKK